MTDNNTPPAPPKPIQYDVKVELLVPTTITYRVIALNEQEALKEVDKYTARQVAVKQNISRKIKLKATVYTAHSTMIKYSKTYRSF